MQALDKKKLDDVACGEIETAHPGHLGSQDTFYVGTLKGVGRIYQQTYIYTYAKVAQCKLYTTILRTYGGTKAEWKVTGSPVFAPTFGI